MIDDNIWQGLERLYQETPSIKSTNSTDEQIDEAQQEIGTMFSDFYRHFLKYHQVSVLGLWKMYKLNDDNVDDYTELGSTDWLVTRETNAFRKNINTDSQYKNCYIIGCSNDNANLLAINKQREVWILNKNDVEPAVKLAENFEQFLYQVLV